MPREAMDAMDLVEVLAEFRFRTSTKQLVNIVTGKRTEGRGHPHLQELVEDERFLAFQQHGLRMYVGILAYLDITEGVDQPQLYYLWNDPRACLQFRHFKRDEARRWIADPSVEAKRAVADEARRQRGHVEFYRILNDPDHRRLSRVESQYDVIYAPDGEESAMCLAWALRLYRQELADTWPDWNRIDGERRWLPRRLEHICSYERVRERAHDDIDSWPRLDERRTLRSELRLLGLIDHEGRATGRFYRMLRWLLRVASLAEEQDKYRRPQSTEAIFKLPSNDIRDQLQILVDKYRCRVGSPVSTTVEQDDWLLLSAVLLSPEEDAHTFENRLRFPVDARYRTRLCETAARGWLVLPVLRYPLIAEGDVKEVGFFLCGFEDCLPDSEEPLLSEDNQPTTELVRLLRAYQAFAPVAAYADNICFYHTVLDFHDRNNLREMARLEGLIEGFLGDKPQVLLKILRDSAHGKRQQRGVLSKRAPSTLTEMVFHQLLARVLGLKAELLGNRIKALPKGEQFRAPDGAFTVRDRYPPRGRYCVLYDCKSSALPEVDPSAFAYQFRYYAGSPTVKRYLERQGLLRKDVSIRAFLLLTTNTRVEKARALADAIREQEPDIKVRVWEVDTLVDFLTRAQKEKRGRKFYEAIEWAQYLIHDDTVVFGETEFNRIYESAVDLLG